MQPVDWLLTTPHIFIPTSFFSFDLRKSISVGKLITDAIRLGQKAV